VECCDFETTQSRARPAHLLRVHHLLFRPYGEAPIPLGDLELGERLEALRRRNRGAEQRRREKAREAQQRAFKSA
jgi:hypothetical protein